MHHGSLLLALWCLLHSHVSRSLLRGLGGRHHSTNLAQTGLEAASILPHFFMLHLAPFCTFSRCLDKHARSYLCLTVHVRLHCRAYKNARDRVLRCDQWLVLMCHEHGYMCSPSHGLCYENDGQSLTGSKGSPFQAFNTKYGPVFMDAKVPQSWLRRLVRIRPFATQHWGRRCL